MPGCEDYTIAFGQFFCVIDPTMKDQDLQNRLQNTVADIEEVSGVELVVVMVPRVARYSSPQLWGGAVVALLSLGIFLFSPVHFTLPLIYLGTVLAYVAGALVVGSIAPLRRLLLSRRHCRQLTERLAAQVFVQNHLYNTSQRTGLLVLFSQQERTVAIVADTGVEDALGTDWLQGLKDNLTRRWRRSGNPANVPDWLTGYKGALATGLPPRHPNFNELPDLIKVEL